MDVQLTCSTANGMTVIRHTLIHADVLSLDSLRGTTTGTRLNAARRRNTFVNVSS